MSTAFEKRLATQWLNSDGRTLIEFHVFHYVAFSMVVSIHWASEDGQQFDHDRDGRPFLRGTDFFLTRGGAVRFVEGARLSELFTYEVTVH